MVVDWLLLWLTGVLCDWLCCVCCLVGWLACWLSKFLLAALRERPLEGRRCLRLGINIAEKVFGWLDV